MPRYITRPHADWLEDRPHLEGKTVYEPEPIDTGLLDRSGAKLYRATEPVGFVPLKERG